MGRNTSLLREIQKEERHDRILFIVEGDDDPKFYEKIVLEMTEEANFKFRTIKQVSGTPGCKKIVEEFEKIQNELDEQRLCHVLGIIDGDSFYYLADAEKIAKRRLLKGVLTLQYYSYESYALTKENIKIIFSELTNYELEELTDEIMEFIWNKLTVNVLDEMFYVGLDCLKHGQDSSYSYTFRYDESEKDVGNGLNRRHMMKNLNKLRLQQFAEDKNIHNSLLDIRKFVKGKHLIYACANEIVYLLKQLEKNCINSNEETVCTYENYCDFLREDTCCRWKNTGKYTADNLYDMMIKKVDFAEVEDIMQRFAKLDLSLKPKYAEKFLN